MVIKIMNKEIPIVFSGDDYYVPYISSMVQSIMENADTNRRYRIIILHQHISENSTVLLSEQISVFPYASLQFIDLSQYVAQLNLSVNCGLTVETYFRFFAPYLLTEYDRIIYFDGDMICNGDVSELFDVDLQENIIGAVRDIGTLWYYYSRKHTKEKDIENRVACN
ncbi:MAG: hypothetical protein Ta2B_17240 [Termitinemataceae bacterium]|nr:MAG: hypothetical protein Ta2B_17240 [Termitinemataceae bacterium]